MYRKLFATIVATVIACCAVAQKHIYISPLGNDNNDGTKEAPMRSLHAAINMAISTTETETAYIEVTEGDYIMEQACRITASNTRPIVVRATKGQARFIGGKRITNWERTGSNRYRAHIAETIDNGFTFEQLYINGQRATLARTPNNGFYKVGDISIAVTDSGKSTRDCYATMCVSGDKKELAILEHVWPGDNGQPKVSFYHKWSNSKMHIDVINKVNYTFNVGGKRFPPFNSITKDTPYFLYDFAHALDSPGEWYMDYNSGYLSYIPRNGEEIDSMNCFIPTKNRWLTLNGDPNGYIENITFENITFEVSRYTLPRAGYYPSQAAAITEAAIELNYTKNITFTDCTFAHTGASAIWIKKMCQGTTVQGCYIHDIGTIGIKIGLTTHKDGDVVTSGCTIDNNIIRDGGREIAEGVGIAIFHAAGNKVTHNDISGFSYTGISMGWEWGYGSSPACDNTIAYNHIHHIGNGVLSDLGGIYTLGEGTGNTITGNVIHDIEAANYGGWGIYTDEGSSNIAITDNLVFRCADGAFHQHYGKNNRIENNIFGMGNNCQIRTSRAETHNSFTFCRNIIIQEKGKTAMGRWFDANMEINNNIYWSYGNGLNFCNKDSITWMEKRERSAVFADPMMKNPQAGDFTFKSRKTIKKIGFKPFDYSKAGVYGSKAWKAKAGIQQTSTAL